MSCSRRAGPRYRSWSRCRCAFDDAVGIEGASERCAAASTARRSHTALERAGVPVGQRERRRARRSARRRARRSSGPRPPRCRRRAPTASTRSSAVRSPSSHSGPSRVGERLAEEPDVGGVDVVAADAGGSSRRGSGAGSRPARRPAARRARSSVASSSTSPSRSLSELAAGQHAGVVAGQQRRCRAARASPSCRSAVADLVALGVVQRGQQRVAGERAVARQRLGDPVREEGVRRPRRRPRRSRRRSDRVGVLARDGRHARLGQVARG